MNDIFNYKRRRSTVTQIGDTALGGENPIRIQSMTNTDTNDIEGSAAQCARIIEAGADYVRLTAQGIREAESLRGIKERVRQKGYTTPLIADIHFNRHAAETAAAIVEKVRINPGNYIDKMKSFAEIDYTDEEYQAEIERFHKALLPLLDICRQHHTALRIGVNHGSLSDRIMSRYGNTPEGMVESCMEVLRICSQEGFSDIVISMKASNTVLMTQCVRLLIETMDKEGFAFPLHLGVTEAGKGEDGRIKSAVGIGALLADGIGDTIRVSLSEDPEVEVPVARKLVAYIEQRKNHPKIEGQVCESHSPRSGQRRKTRNVLNIGGGNLPVVIGNGKATGAKSLFEPDYMFLTDETTEPNKHCLIESSKWDKNSSGYPVFDRSNRLEIEQTDSTIKFVKLAYSDLDNAMLHLLKNDKAIVVLLETTHLNGVGEQRAFFHRLMINDCDVPVVICRSYEENNTEDLQLKAAADLGTLLLDGFGDGIYILNKGNVAQTEIDKCMFGILQAARLRNSKTEYISCPGCGRTLFDLQTTVDRVQKATSHLKHLKIAVMGCVVNGVGEMGDADYGYVGAAKGKVSLYKEKEVIERNIPSELAVEKLIELIKKNGDWKDPEQA